MSAIITPFNKENFADDMKPKISGADLSLEYENIESSVCKVAEDCIEVLSEPLYEAICQDKGTTDEKLQAKALDYLQRSMLHFCLYQVICYVCTNI